VAPVELGGAIVTGSREEGAMTLTMHQLLTGLALLFAVVTILPAPNIRPYWTLAVAVLLLAVLQFLMPPGWWERRRAS
jgi:hypothetical protein